MKIKKSLLETVYVSLDYPIKNFSKARVRDGFTSLLMGQIKTYYSERTKILEELCIKDEEGKPIKEKDQYTFTPENEVQAIKEVEILNNEETSIEITKDIKELIENSQADLRTGMAETLSVLLK